MEIDISYLLFLLLINSIMYFIFFPLLTRRRSFSVIKNNGNKKENIKQKTLIIKNLSSINYLNSRQIWFIKQLLFVDNRKKLELIIQKISNDRDLTRKQKKFIKNKINSDYQNLYNDSIVTDEIILSVIQNLYSKEDLTKKSKSFIKHTMKNYLNNRKNKIFPAVKV